MGRVSRGINEAISKDRPQAEQDGLKISDEVFELWEREIDGRHSMHGWYGSPRLVVLNGVRILDENGEQRRWPKAHGPFPCPDCSGTGHEKHGLDGSRAPGFGDCLSCDGTGIVADTAEERRGEMSDQKADSEITVHCADCDKIVAYATEITLIRGGGAARIDPDKSRRPDNLAPVAGENLCPVDGTHTLILKPYAFKSGPALIDAAEKWAEAHRALGATTTKREEAEMEAKAAHAKLVLEAFGWDAPRTEVIRLKDGATVTVEATAFRYSARLEEGSVEVDTPRAILEKQGVSIWQTWNRKGLSIEDMLNSFPFEKILSAMKAAGWKWRGATPTLEQIKGKAGELLRSLDGGLGQAVTGGFAASRWRDEYTLRFPSLSKEENDLTDKGAPA